MKLSRYFQARKRASNPARISWRNIWAVIQAWFRRKRRNIGGFDLDNHIYEQIIWRRTQVMKKSPECWDSGSCTVCGCEILGKTMEDRGCSLQEHPELRRSSCYPEMMNKEDWKAYKKFKHIKLFE